METRPWQYDWKRPQLEIPTDTNVVSDVDTRQKQLSFKGRTICVASAEVSSKEVPAKYGSIQAANGSLMIHVTVASSKETNAGDLVLLELFFQESLTSDEDEVNEDSAVESTTTIQSSMPTRTSRLDYRVLRWPGVALGETALLEEIQEAEKEEETQSKTKWKRQVTNILGVLNEGNTQVLSGVMSVCFCRRPAGDSKAAAMDALDIVSLMSLGLDPGQNPEKHLASAHAATTTAAATTAATTTEESNKPQSPVSSGSQPELVLAFLSNDSRLHLYNPWKLFDDGPNRETDVVENGMARFFLGDGLMQQLQEYSGVLSQPDATVELTIERGRRQTQRQANKVEAAPESTREEVNVTISGRVSYDIRDDKVAIWDPSVWDPIIDLATTIYRTNNNNPSICIAAFDFIAIAGPGRRIRRNRQPNIIGPKTEPLTGPDAGFITFVSIRRSTEVRTLFLPFVPLKVSPFAWGAMEFVLVVGENVVIAIRVDNSQHTVIPAGTAPLFHSSSTSSESNNPRINPSEGTHPGAWTSPSHTLVRNNNSSSSNNKTNSNGQGKLCNIRRFQMLPIHLPDEDPDIFPENFGSSLRTSPPGLTSIYSNLINDEVLVLQKSFQSIDSLPRETSSRLFRKYRPTIDSNILSISVTHKPSHAARIAVSDDLLDAKWWCHVDQGICFLGAQNHVYGICWEGSSTSEGAYIQEFEHSLELSIEKNSTMISEVLPLDPKAISEIVQSYAAKLKFPGTDGELVDEVATSNPVAVAKVKAHDHEHEDTPFIEEFLIEAIESISLRRIGGENEEKSSNCSTLSHRERALRLLSHCSSWTLLKNTGTVEKGQAPTFMIHFGAPSEMAQLLSLRRQYHQNFVATPYHKILSWLFQKNDYFTAGSVALDLLQDGESLFQLWKAYNRLDEEYEQTKLEGLLDGVIDLRTLEVEDSLGRSSNLTQLADMTVGCLIRGGFRMSAALSNFLRTNLHYHSSRASLMLVAMATACVSNVEEDVKRAMGKDYHLNHENVEDRLWAVRCLLETAVSKDTLPQTFLLINAAIPDELRRRDTTGDDALSDESVQLSTALMETVVEASEDSVLLLLDLFDDSTQARFWPSLDPQTQLAFSLLWVNGTYPFLLSGEVRYWTMSIISACLNTEGASGEATAAVLELSSDWLRSLCHAVVTNAGCDQSALISIEAATSESNDENPTTYGDGVNQFSEQMEVVLESLRAAKGSNGLDFGLLIPALLILEIRKEKWAKNKWPTTQSILNGACYSAGRVTMEEPLFSFDISTAMRQCYVANNVRAGANLVGGRNGFVLECCCILVEECGMSMVQAESYLVRETLASQKNQAKENLVSPSWDGILTPGHRHILWLLDRHVLHLRTYGEFQTDARRGHVDPIFAARTCLRAWYCMTKDYMPSVSIWLASWLREQLGIGSDGEVSKKRLASAALARVLFWPTEEDGDYTMAEHLALDLKILLEIVQAAWTVVESVPPHLLRINEPVAGC